MYGGGHLTCEWWEWGIMRIDEHSFKIDAKEHRTSLDFLNMRACRTKFRTCVSVTRNFQETCYLDKISSTRVIIGRRIGGQHIIKTLLECVCKCSFYIV